jgi:methionyl-tRNA formyltransferase
MPLPLPPSRPGDIRRVAFLGTPEIAVPTLRGLHAAGFEIPIVISGADKRRGRGRDLSPTPVKAAAIELGLAVSAEVDDLLAEHERESIDLAVIVAFGQLIRMSALTQIPMVNTHFSRLPRWRGAAPVERAILAGDTSTAISVMSVVEGLDEGDVWASVDVPIGVDDTLSSLWESMSLDGADLMIETMRGGFTEAEPQVGESLYARKLTADDLQLDWNRPAADLLRIVRVGNAWTTVEGERFKIHDAEVVHSMLDPGVISALVVGTGDAGLGLTIVQPAGKPRMDAAAWANGARPDGSVFGV